MKKQIPNNIELDEYEKELEANLELCSRLSLVDEAHEITKLVTAAKNHVKVKKAITIRVSPHDLEIMRLKASKLGIPYQTYINILIHKDASVF